MSKKRKFVFDNLPHKIIVECFLKSPGGYRRWYLRTVGIVAIGFASVIGDDFVGIAVQSGRIFGRRFC